MEHPATGFHIGSRRDSQIDEVIASAKLADELGYDTIWVGESWGWDVFTTLTMIACHTERIRLGTGIATVFSRSPAMTAQSIASLDVISGGRATLGLGTSGRIVIEDWHGVEYRKPLERTREYINIIRLILSGQRVDFQGKMFNLAPIPPPLLAGSAKYPDLRSFSGAQEPGADGRTCRWLAPNMAPRRPSPGYVSYR